MAIGGGGRGVVPGSGTGLRPAQLRGPHRIPCEQLCVQPKFRLDLRKMIEREKNIKNRPGLEAAVPTPPVCPNCNWD